MCVCDTVVLCLAAHADLPKGINSGLYVNRKDLNLEAVPFAAGGFAQIFRGTYKRVPVALKEIHSHLVAIPDRCGLRSGRVPR